MKPGAIDVVLNRMLLDHVLIYSLCLGMLATQSEQRGKLAAASSARRPDGLRPDILPLLALGLYHSLFVSLPVVVSFRSNFSECMTSLPISIYN